VQASQQDALLRSRKGAAASMLAGAAGASTQGMAPAPAAKLLGG
jgi:hypothetical protein